MSSIKLAFRNIQKNKSYSLINILGLTLAFTLCLLVFSVVIEENSYDKSWSKADRIYRINTIENTKGIEGEIPQAFANLGLELKRQFPEVEASSAIFPRNIFLKLDNDETVQINSLFLHKEAFDILDFEILEGKPLETVAGKRNIMIDQEFKEKYFKDENVIGKIIKTSDPLLDRNEMIDFIITGVFKKLPYNSTLRSSVITFSSVMKRELSKNGDGYYQDQYISLKPNTDINEFTKKVNSWYKDFLNDSAVTNYTFRFQPLQEVYMNPLAQSSISGNKRSSTIILGIAILVLIISSINFINLYAVRTIKKIKSFNLHKIMGANRFFLIKILLIETQIIFLFSAILSIIIYLLAISPLELFLNFKLVYIHEIFPTIIFSFLIAVILLGGIIGLYPALIISNIKPAQALKNKISKVSNSEVWTKRTLIIVQFCISLIVIFGLITMKSQMNLIQNSPKGINTDNLLNIKSLYLSENSNSIKNELLKNPAIENVSISAWSPNMSPGFFSRNVDNKDNPDQKIMVNFIGGDKDLVPMLDIKLIEGRLLRESDYYGYPKPNPQYEGDEVNNVLITKSTAKTLGIKTLGIPYKGLDIIPVGIVEDFHSESFHESIKPTVILAQSNQEYGNILIKIKEGQEKSANHGIGVVMKKFFPDRYINYEWVDELEAKNYQKETKQAQLFTFFSFLALFISALGVTGLILQSVEQRTKEVGIRKVLGASVVSISNLFAKEYLLLIIMAVILSSPIAWYLANKWLEDFAYKTEIQWWFFGVSGLIILLTTLITVNIQTIKAALANPVDSLREE
ncbi:ABC transporter permease [Sphingobacterium sp. 1.A.5]|jgi:putative ABC transport system permease protein|uniref:ABC transporter permease n=1 Tax=Sphingobacterium sp. 1.A.5 TaxID=2044604 RepID=UPI000C0BDA1D|nr:ABC transporter permease [Sphingobacterium sp. 1.A.5]